MNHYLIVGTYTGGSHSDLEITGSRGIYVYQIEPNTNKLRFLDCCGQGQIDPAFLAVKGNTIVTENERRDSLTLQSFQITGDGKMEWKDCLTTTGSKCAHVCFDPVGNYLIGAGYSSGNVAVASYKKNGKMELTDLVFHKGRSIVPKRQECPHAHSARFSPDGKELFVPDLGMDKVMNYEFQRETGKLTENPKQPYVTTDPGEGPRHFCFHPFLPVAYLLTEIGNHIYVYQYEKTERTLKQIQKISVLPDGYNQVSYGAELIVSEDGKFLYSSNRGHDSIGVFVISESSGTLKASGWFPCGGRGPRHICFGPGEKTVIVANKESDNLAVLERDSCTGAFGQNYHTYSVPAPACAALAKVE